MWHEGIRFSLLLTYAPYMIIFNNQANYADKMRGNPFVNKILNMNE